MKIEIPPFTQANSNVQNNKSMCKIECYVNDNLQKEGRKEGEVV